MHADDLKNKFIRETEEAINRKTEAVEDLMAQAVTLENEITEHRRLLVLLKRNHKALALSTDNGQPPEETKPASTIKHVKVETPKPQVRYNEEDFIGNLQEMGEFTSVEAAELLDLTTSAVQQRLNMLLKRGLVKQIKPPGKFVPRVGKAPAVWKAS